MDKDFIKKANDHNVMMSTMLSMEVLSNNCKNFSIPLFLTADENIEMMMNTLLNTEDFDEIGIPQTNEKVFFDNIGNKLERIIQQLTEENVQ